MRAHLIRRPLVAGLCIAALIASLAAIGLPASAFGQSVSPADALRLLQRGDQDDQDNNGSTVKPTIQTYPPAVAPTQLPATSHLEKIYRARANEGLEQFGYDVLGVPQQAAIVQAGAVPDHYILGSNDELVVSLRGQENASYRLRIDRDGNVTLPKLAPIQASGRSFGDFRADLERNVSTAYVATKVFVTLGSIHQLSVLVSGEVRVPGVRIVSGLANPLDVILLSGGIKKTGSLRSVRVINGTTSRVIDLYSVIAQGNAANLGALRDGDRVYVPPLGATAAVSGDAARPAIYELPPGASAISAMALLRLAGGPEIAGAFSLSRLGVQRDGTLSLQPIEASAIIHSGEVLFVGVSQGAVVGRIKIYGAVADSGTRPLSTNRSVSEIFRSASDLSLFGYAPFAIIRRRDTTTNAITLIPFSVTGAIRKTRDIPLQDEDVIFVFSRAEAVALANLVVKDVNTAYSPMTENPGDYSSPSSDAASIPGMPGGQAAPAQTVLRDTPSLYRLEPSPSPTGGVLDSAEPTQQGGLAAAAPGGSGQSSGSGNSNSPYNADPRFSNPASQTTGSEASALAQAQNLLDRNGRLNKPLDIPPESDEKIVSRLARIMTVSNDALLRTAADNLAWVLDQVREPGPYLAAKGTSIADLIQAAGGYQQTADLSEIEVTSTEVDQTNGRTRTTRTGYNQADGQMTVGSIRPQDVVRVRPVYSDREEGTVTVAGEVRYPGVFDITRDERLSSLLQRAGGMTEVAYPYGAIFTRKEAALTEKEGNERSARELENQIPALMFAQSSSNTDYSTAGAYLASLVRSLRQMPALGRIVVTADPTVLATKPELDFVLQPGDTLYIPKRPSTVTVSGEVRNPGSFQYRAGLRFSEYLRLAGGTTQNADDSRTFVVMPDGSATPVDSDWLSFGGGGNIPPGATVVVPRDLRPFNWTQFLKDTTQIISQLAVAAASLSVLRNN